MKFELKNIHRNVSDDELVNDLKNTAQKLNQDFVTQEQQNEFGNFDSSNMAHRLGGWAKAHELANLKLSRHQKTRMWVSDDELFQNLEEIWTKLGHQPIQTDMFPPLSKYGAGIYKKHFGTWMKALEKFVEYINAEENISSGHAIKNIAIEPATKHKTSRNINWRLRFIVMKRDNFKCQSCGRSPATDPSIVLHVDHKTAWAKSGETILENLQTLCSKCNLGKSDIE